MRQDIYYVLENWAPRLTKNEIYKKLIKEIIPVTQTYHVNDIWSADHLIELLPTDQGKTIRVDSVDAKESKETEERALKIEYSCCINGENDTSYKATTAISEGEGTDLVYSYIEIYNLEKYEYFSTTTVTISTISKTDHEDYILKGIQTEKCIYDKETLEISSELNGKLKEISNVNSYTDYTEELRKIIKKIRQKQFFIPDLQLSMDAVMDSENSDYYQMLYDGHNVFPTKQKQEKIDEITNLSNLSLLSLDVIIGRINSLNLFQGGYFTKGWKRHVQKTTPDSISDNLVEFFMETPSYSIDEFIEKVSPEIKVVKQKNRKDG